MPRRTNDFQELIALLHQQMAPSGATVTESEMVLDKATGDVREVDITIQYEIAGIPITIAIECRDHKRPADVLWIEQLMGKFLNRATRIVAVSRSGFTPQALEKAAAVGIETMTIAAARDRNWIAWVEAIDRLRVTLVLHSLAGIGSVNLVDKSIKPEDYGDIRVTEVNFESAVDGSMLGTAVDIYNRVIDESRIDPIIDDAPRRPDGLIEVRLGLGGTYLTAPDGRRLAVEGVLYLVREEIETIDIPLQPGEYAARSVATGAASGADWTVKVAYVQGDDRIPRMSLRLARVHGDVPPGRVVLYGIGEPIPPPTS